ncbi:hypothetical protein PHJA_000576500 [Phtheirospermum japonicum]|uniref:Uncharacterized protein n=1 Tax=Phtheirospermum japonicum TaxID=374723 RepID=A0A830BGT6_9LAMI|nr:hypothetical protein PHJA_000576500 [Phtheirospermum japonicum]
MNEYRCYFHPREFVIGICALCLNDRLLVLAAKQGTIHHHHHQTQKKAITKIFALASLFNLLEIKKQKADDQYCLTSSTSPEESFISIKFEDNGVASWDKGKISKMPFDRQCKAMPWNENVNKDRKKMKSMVEHAKPRAALRWRRRIGHLFQLVRLKKSTKGTMCHVSTKPRRSKS